MRSFFIIALLIVLSLLKCHAQQEVNQNRILLLQYIENTECKILEIDNKKADPDKEFCGDFIPIIDDFSEFYDVIRVFHFDDDGDRNDNWNKKLDRGEPILFWEYFNKTFIDTFPYRRNRVQLDSLYADTIVFTYKNKIRTLKPGEVFIDSIITLKREDNKLLQYTTYLYLKNHGLISRNNIVYNKAWRDKGKEEELVGITNPDTLPQFPGGDEAFSKYLTDNIIYPEITDSSMTNKELLVIVAIGKDGKLTVTKTLKSISPKFDQHVIDVLEASPLWVPGMKDGKHVCVQMGVPIRIGLGE